MATYHITFADPDPYSERNGEHSPVSSGAAFIATYGEGLGVDDLASDIRELAERDIDGLGVGERVDVLGEWGELITVERVA